MLFGLQCHAVLHISHSFLHSVSFCPVYLEIQPVLFMNVQHSGSDLPGGLGGFNPPNDFFDPPSLRRFELLGGGRF